MNYIINIFISIAFITIKYSLHLFVSFIKDIGVNQRVGDRRSFMGPDSGRTSFRDGMDIGGQVFKTVQQKHWDF